MNDQWNQSTLEMYDKWIEDAAARVELAESELEELIADRALLAARTAKPRSDLTDFIDAYIATPFPRPPVPHEFQGKIASLVQPPIYAGLAIITDMWWVMGERSTLKVSTVDPHGEYRTSTIPFEKLLGEKS